MHRVTVTARIRERSVASRHLADVLERSDDLRVVIVLAQRECGHFEDTIAARKRQHTQAFRHQRRAAAAPSVTRRARAARQHNSRHEPTDAARTRRPTS